MLTCGHPDPSILWSDDCGETYYYICAQCYSYRGTCVSCKDAQTCPFETADISLPKIIQQTYQQGPMTVSQTVKNPARIEETCKKLCKCWNPDFGCLKENYTCGDWTPHYLEEKNEEILSET